MSVDINKLNVFVAIAEEGSLIKAARQLRTTRQTVTLHLRNLEDTLDLALFERSGFRIGKLTAHGERLLPIARRVLGHCSDFEQEIATLRRRSRSDLDERT